ncbi:MAG: hypothetical protein NC299_09055 [Lachnospiraceae bacterium]|nr:hypothetical protein [Lachnospiraceae bacterium]
MSENKQAICSKLAETLKLTRQHYDLEEIKISGDETTAVICFNGGFEITVNVNGDSGFVMINDILQAI